MKSKEKEISFEKVIQIVNARLLDWQYHVTYNLSPLWCYQQWGEKRLNEDIDELFKKTREVFQFMHEHSYHLCQLKEIEELKRDNRDLEEEWGKIDKENKELEKKIVDLEFQLKS